jgi:hypothetical protein
MSPVSWAVALLLLSALLASANVDAPAYEIDVADVSTAAGTCPTQDQLAEALEARMPGVVARGGHEPGPNLLHLGLGLSPDGAARVTMTDATGALRLERELALPKGAAGPTGGPREPHERTGACAAIAETVALIVERYMRHIGYRDLPPPALLETKAPATPPQPPAAPPARPRAAGRLGLGLAMRLPYQASWRFEPQLTGALRLGHVELAATMAAAWAVAQDVPMSTGKGTLTLRSFPARLAVGWPLPLGERVTVIPTLGGGIDVVLAETRGIDVTRRSAAVEPTLEGGVRAVAAITRRVWIDVHAFQGIDLRPEEFIVTLPSGPERVLLTPRAYTRLGVDFGVFLGKN